jgi:outer membrane protein
VKNLNALFLAIFGVALVGILVWLFMLHGSVSRLQAENSAMRDSLAIKDSIALPNLPITTGDIAYIDYEQLTSKYDFYSQSLKRLESDFEKKQKDLFSEEKALRASYERYQQLAPSLTKEIAMQKEEELMRKQQELQQKMQKYEADFAQMEQRFQSDFLKNIDSYFRDLSKEKKYDYIFVYSKGAPAVIVYANDSLNITSSAIKGLNLAFKNKK